MRSFADLMSDAFEWRDTVGEKSQKKKEQLRMEIEFGIDAAVKVADRFKRESNYWNDQAKQLTSLRSVLAEPKVDTL